MEIWVVIPPLAIKPPQSFFVNGLLFLGCYSYFSDGPVNCRIQKPFCLAATHTGATTIDMTISVCNILSIAWLKIENFDWKIEAASDDLHRSNSAMQGLLAWPSLLLNILTCDRRKNDGCQIQRDPISQLGPWKWATSRGALWHETWTSQRSNHLCGVSPAIRSFMVAFFVISMVHSELSVYRRACSSASPSCSTRCWL